MLQEIPVREMYLLGFLFCSFRVVVLRFFVVCVCIIIVLFDYSVVTNACGYILWCFFFFSSYIYLIFVVVTDALGRLVIRRNPFV